MLSVLLLLLLAVGAATLSWRDFRREAWSLSPVERELRKRRFAADLLLFCSAVALAYMLPSGWNPGVMRWVFAAGAAGLGAAVVLTILIGIARRRLVDQVSGALRRMDEHQGP